MRCGFQNLTRTVLLALICLFGQANAAEQIFSMEEFSIFEYDGAASQYLQSMLSSRRCQTEPAEDVKVYPQLKSSQPLYGQMLFYSETLLPRIEFSFVLDESQGTGKGYDRLYFDANRDQDLTNDAVVKKSTKPPVHDDRLYFDTLTFTYQGSTVSLVPMLHTLRPDYRRLVCVFPTARRGTIKIGKQEHQAILARTVLSRGYEHPFTSLILDDQITSGMETVGYMRLVDDSLYQCSASANGETLTVKTYEGDYGTITIADPKKQFKSVEITNGLFLGKDKILDFGQCPKVNDKPQIPVGDYIPIRLVMTVDQIRLGFGIDSSGEEPPEYSISIQKNQAFAYSLASQPDVRFESPATEDKICCDQDVRVSACMVVPTINVLLQGMEDLKKSQGEITLADGTVYKRGESIDPTVVITNSMGKVVAEGTMPFG